MKNKIIIWGGTGNFKVLCELLDNSYEIIGYFDRNSNISKCYHGIPYLGNMDSFESWIKSCENITELFFINSMGPGLGKERLEMHQYLLGYGLKPITAIHSNAFVAPSAKIGVGSQVYAQSAICVDAVIGKCCIINTSASVDHECVLDDGVSVGPGARLAGLVQVGKYADIYTGAIVLPRVTIGEGAVVGAGAVVLRDIEPYIVVAGNPAKIIKRIQHDE